MPDPVTSNPKSGSMSDVTIEPCSAYGILVVTLDYGEGEADKDATVDLNNAYIEKTIEDERIVFKIDTEDTYIVQINSARWIHPLKYYYQGVVKKNHHTSVVVPLVLPALTLDSPHTHFAPDAETLGAAFVSQHLDGDTIKISIADQAGTLVYEHGPAAYEDGRHADPLTGWKGKGNQGTYNNKYITPLQSPYTIKVEAQTTGRSAEAEVKVLYRSIEMGFGTYTEDEQAPVEGGAGSTDRKKWVQYKLNELGYFAGPVDGNIGNQTLRAMRRYAYEHTNLQESRVRISRANFVDHDPFRNALRGGDCARTILENGALPNADAEAKLYIDYNYFYERMTDFSDNQGHLALDRDRLDRFELPLEVSITLLSKNDADGTSPGIVSPEAVGPVKIQWTAIDMPEDMNRYPDPTQNCPTKMKAYLTAATNATKEGTATNCPVALGGARHPTPNTNRNYFRLGTTLPPYTSTNNNDDVYTEAYTGATAVKKGKAGILFRGSYIGGDRYTLKAQLSFYGLGHKDPLESDHEDVLGEDWQEKLTVETGTLTIWRRQRVARIINWPAPARTAINWANVIPEYAYAYCELVSNNPPITGTQFLNNYLGLQQGTYKSVLNADITGAMDGSQMPIDGTALFKINLPAQGNTEYARVYKQRINSFLKTALDLSHDPNNPGRKYRALIQFAGYIADFVKPQDGPGFVIIHAKWVPTIDIWHRPKKKWGTSVQDTFDPGLSCLGLPRGVSIYAHSMFPDYSDQFLITHEMGHNRFLHHHEVGHDELGTTKRNTLGYPQWHKTRHPSATSSDHDLNDHNCTMCYPWGIPSRNSEPLLGFIGTRVSLEWNYGDAKEAAFCGKCLLKLRGWDIIDAALPRQSP